MLDMGFTRYVTDHAVFYKRSGESAIIVATSVDDLTIAGTTDLIAAFATRYYERIRVLAEACILHPDEEVLARRCVRRGIYRRHRNLRRAL